MKNIKFEPARLVPMKYLVWMSGLQGPMPQLWSEDTVTSFGKDRILLKQELKGDEQLMYLTDLVKIYPCPTVRNEP